MNKVTITEANRKFSHLIKQVESEGRVAITKGGDIRYIILTGKEYEKMNTKLTFGQSLSRKVCVEQGDENKVWLFSGNGSLESYTVYTADKLNITGDFISLEAEKYFKVSFWEDFAGEPDERAKELYEMFPVPLHEYKLSVKSRDKTWE